MDWQTAYAQTVWEEIMSWCLRKIGEEDEKQNEVEVSENKDSAY